MLTLVLLSAALTQTPSEPDGPAPHELTMSLELTGGRQLGLATFFDFGLLPDQLYLNVGYSLLKPPALAATDTTPALPTSATHVFFIGADLTVGRHLTLSGLLSGSPKATDAVLLNPNAPPRLQVTVATSRRSLGGSLLAAWNTAGLSRFEWVIDAGLGVTANGLGRTVKVASFGRETEDSLVAIRASLGVTLTVLDKTDLSWRGGYDAYTADPLTVGRFDGSEKTAIGRAGTDSGVVTTDVETLSRAAQQATGRLAQADALSGYASAPIWLESKVTALHRFGERWSGQLGWTWNRYVPTAGYANILSSKVTVRLGAWRLWLGAALQLDQPQDHPPTGVRPAVSGTVAIGSELTLEH